MLRTNGQHDAADQKSCGRPNERRVTGAGIVLVAALALVVPQVSVAADWLAPGADQTVTAPWVHAIVTQLNKESYRDIFANAPAEPPHPAVVRYLNSAAQALKAGKKALARSYIDRTIDIFEDGVQRGYYSRSDVEPVMNMIRARADAAMQGKQVATVTQADDRWVGYTHHKPLGLTNDQLRMKDEHPKGKR